LPRPSAQPLPLPRPIPDRYTWRVRKKQATRRQLVQWSSPRRPQSPSPKPQSLVPNLHAPSDKPRESGGDAGKSPSGFSPRSSASWSRSYLQRDSGRNSDRNVDCNPARTLGRNLTRYSARNRTRSSSHCSRGSGRGSGGNSRTSSPPRSSGYSSGRDFGSYVDSYGGGIGGVGEGIGAMVLGLWELGPLPERGGMCTIIHIKIRERAAIPTVRARDDMVIVRRFLTCRSRHLPRLPVYCLL